MYHHRHTIDPNAEISNYIPVDPSSYEYVIHIERDSIQAGKLKRRGQYYECNDGTS